MLIYSESGVKNSEQLLTNYEAVCYGLKVERYDIPCGDYFGLIPNEHRH